MQTPTTILTAHDAIAYAERSGCDLWKFADPTEDGRRVTVDEAREIAQEDPSLLWIDTADHERAPWDQVDPAPASDLTDRQIRTLSTEAGSHGDTDCVDLCQRALDGDGEARARVAEIIADAEAQADGGAR